MQDHYEQLAWIGKFLNVCTDHIDDQLQARGWYDGACPLLMLCKNVITSVQGVDSYNYFVLLNNLAAALTRQHRLDEDKSMYKQALRILEAHFQPLAAPSQRDMLLVLQSYHATATMYHLSLVYIEQNRLEDAEALSREILRKLLLKCGKDSSDAAVAAHNLCVVLDQRGPLDEAEAQIREAIRVRELHLGRGSLEVASSLSCIAIMDVKRNQFVEGGRKLKEVLRVQQPTLGADSPELIIAGTLSNLAELKI